MQHLFVPYELALLLKEKGFDEPCLATYYTENSFKEYGFKKGDYYISDRSNSSLKDKTEIAAPLYQQVIDWFREKHDINISVDRNCDINPLYQATTVFIEDGEVVSDWTAWRKEYYFVLIRAIETALTLI